MPEANNLLSDPCAIVLAPHEGKDRLDWEIIRRQRQARDATNSVLYLDRLGWAFVAKARTSSDPGFYKLAEQAAWCIEAKRPGSTEALLLRGHVLHNLHRFKEGEALARRLVAQRGLWFDYGLLGDLLMEQGKLNEAVEAYQTMMDQRPGPQAYSRAAHIRWLKGDLKGAIELMQMAVRANGSPRDPASAAWINVRLALYQLQAGQISEASNCIATALALHPKYAPALLVHGQALLAEGKNQEALTALQRAAQLNPLPEYQWALIEALRLAGRLNEAQTVDRQLIERGAAADRRTFALYLTSTSQEIKTALRLAQEELKARADVFTLDALAWALQAAGRPQEARTYSLGALSEGTQDARLFYHAGVIAALVDQKEEAARWFTQAAAIRQMLLPSEREHLAKGSAQLTSAETTLASSHRNARKHLSKTHDYFIRRVL